MSMRTGTSRVVNQLALFDTPDLSLMPGSMRSPSRWRGSFGDGADMCSWCGCREDYDGEWTNAAGDVRTDSQWHDGAWCADITTERVCPCCVFRRTDLDRALAVCRAVAFVEQVTARAHKRSTTAAARVLAKRALRSERMDLLEVASYVDPPDALSGRDGSGYHENLCALLRALDVLGAWDLTLDELRATKVCDESFEGVIVLLRALMAHGSLS